MPLVNYQFDATYHNGDNEAAYRFWYCKKYHMEDKGQQYVKGHMDFDFVLPHKTKADRPFRLLILESYLSSKLAFHGR